MSLDLYVFLCARMYVCEYTRTYNPNRQTYTLLLARTIKLRMRLQVKFRHNKLHNIYLFVHERIIAKTCHKTRK